MSLVELPGFAEARRRHQWKGPRELVPFYGRRPCIRCSVGEVIRLEPVAQPALFFHGGYGAVERKTIDLCLACGRTVIAEVETLNPRAFT